MTMQRRSVLAMTPALAQWTVAKNDRLRVGIIGSGGRGRFLTAQFKEMGVEMAAVCDVYEPNLQKGLSVASIGAKAYDNYRRLLEDKSIDAVVVASPDHWHAQMTIDAVEAGKDVYVEKPMAHTIEEGFRMVEAVRRTRRVVQVGTQRRSFDLFRDAKKVMDSRATGEVRLVTATWLNRQQSLRSGILDGKLDWTQWLGSAPKRPLDPVRFFNWYYFWDYSGGLMVGQAAHLIDAINWMMNSTYPRAVTAASAGVNVPGAEISETTSLCLEYPENFLATITIGYRTMRYREFNDQIKQFHGARARFDLGREWYALYPEDVSALDMASSQCVRRPGDFSRVSVPAHIRNFIECVGSRKDPNATVEMGQYTNVALCMGMEALRTGRRMVWDTGDRSMKN